LEKISSQESNVETLLKPNFNENDRLSAQAITSIQGNLEKPIESVGADLEKAAIRARLHIPEHVKTHAGREVEYFKIRGRTGEELAKENIPDCVNLNDVTGKSNFANFDVISKHEVASVKVKERFSNGEPRYSGYAKFFCDISNPESKANQQAARELIQSRESDQKLSN
jgi:hypothetical protein